MSQCFRDRIWNEKAIVSKIVMTDMWDGKKSVFEICDGQLSVLSFGIGYKIRKW